MSADRTEHRGYPGVRVVLGHLAARYPRRTALLVFLLLLSGFFEGFGVASLLPLLHLFLGGGEATIGETTGGAWMVWILSTLGLPENLLGVLALLLGAIILKAALLYTSIAIVADASAAIAMAMRRRLLRAVLAAKWPHLTRRKPGELSSVIGPEPHRVAHIYVNGCVGFANGLKAGSYAILAFLISWKVTLAAIVGGLVSFRLLHTLVRVARSSGRDLTLLQARFLGRLVDTLTGVKAIRAMAAEEKLLPALERDLDTWQEVQARYLLSQRSLQIAQEPLRVVALGVVLPFIHWYWGQNPEDLLVLALLFIRINAEIGTLQEIYSSIAGFAAAYFLIHEKTEEAEKARERTGGDPPPEPFHALSLEGVHFDYGGATVLRGADLVIPAGAFVAILGPSGTGKTTVADLLLGLLTPTSGRVLVDDVPLERVDLKVWRRRIGYVPQEPVLLHDSVRANLTLGDEDIPDAVLEDALEAACATEFVAPLEEGLETSVGEHGNRFSGGQRQRLALARALCRRPDLLILDEATSALDPEIERRVCESIRARTQDMTVLAISHQDRITHLADAVYRLEEGQLLREGEDQGTQGGGPPGG